MTIVLLSVVLVLVCSCANTPIWASIVLLSVVLVLVCLCADTLIWARRALSFSLVLGGVCAAMSFGGDSFSPYGAYVFAWDSVKAVKGNTPSIISCTLVDVGCVCTLNDWIAALTFLRRQPQLLPVQVEGQALPQFCSCSYDFVWDSVRLFPGNFSIISSTKSSLGVSAC